MATGHSKKMNCLCGKAMAIIVEEKTDTANWVGPGQMLKNIRVWACPPDGCGRIYLEGSGAEIKGTWYLPEQNERRIEL